MGSRRSSTGRTWRRNLQDLHARLKAKRYRHQPIRRVHIPKDKGKTRPIGISAFEDKLVQDAVREVLEAIYEQDFLDCSYGFRPGRSAHDAVRALDRIVHQGEVNWILEADIVSFFDSLDRTELMEMLRDSGGRWVAAAAHRQVLARGRAGRRGVLRAGVGHGPGVGALAAAWATSICTTCSTCGSRREVKPRLRGKATLIRYCDDFVIGFEREDDARAGDGGARRSGWGASD